MDPRKAYTPWEKENKDDNRWTLNPEQPTWYFTKVVFKVFNKKSRKCHTLQVQLFLMRSWHLQEMHCSTREEISWRLWRASLVDQLNQSYVSMSYKLDRIFLYLFCALMAFTDLIYIYIWVEYMGDIPQQLVFHFQVYNFGIYLLQNYSNVPRLLPKFTKKLAVDSFFNFGSWSKQK